MVVFVVLAKLRAALLFIVGLVKRSLCCFRRRRRSSVDSVPLTQVIGVGSTYCSSVESQDMESWNRWGDGTDRPPQTVQEHIEEYRRQARAKQAATQQAAQQTPELQQQQDFFQDMEPKIKKQAKVLLKSKETEADISTRLAFVPDAFPTSGGSELGAWEEREGSSWGPEASEFESLLREKRREEQRRKLQERDTSKRATLASRVS